MEAEQLRVYIHVVMDGLVYELEQMAATSMPPVFKHEEAKRTEHRALMEICNAARCANQWSAMDGWLNKMHLQAQESTNG